MSKKILVTLLALIVLLSPVASFPQCVVPANGTNLQTTSYSALANDNGKLIIMNCSSACTLTLPSPPPTAVWEIDIRALGFGVVTVSRNGLNIDTSANNLTLNSGETVGIFTDGSNYFTRTSLISPYTIGGGTAQAQTATGFPAGIANTVGQFICWLPAAANTGAAPTLSFNGFTSSPIIKVGGAALVANDLTTTAMACAIYDGTSWELITPQTTSAGGGSTLPYITPMAQNPAGGMGTLAQNQIKIWPILVPAATTTLSKFFYAVQTADNTANSYDIGWYGPGCLSGATNVPLFWHSGTTAGTSFAPSAAVREIAPTSAPSVTTPGWYCMAYTSNAATPAAVLGGDSSTNYWLPFNWAGAGSISGGGATLPSTITAPATGWGSISQVFVGGRQ